MGVTVKLQGLDAVKKAFNKELGKLEDVNSKVLTEVILDLAGEAIRRAPVDTGDLRGSGHAIINGQVVARGTEDGDLEHIGAPPKDARTGEVRFESVYAVKQHEHVEYDHPKGGEAKYLERPFEEKKKLYLAKFAQANKDATKGR